MISIASVISVPLQAIQAFPLASDLRWVAKHYDGIDDDASKRLIRLSKAIAISLSKPSNDPIVLDVFVVSADADQLAQDLKWIADNYDGLDEDATKRFDDMEKAIRIGMIELETPVL
jgi:hypothetical protein